MRRNSPQAHGKPLTRRECVARGLATAVSVASIPTVGNLLAVDAQAQTSSRSMPFIVFDLAGGAGLPGNFLVGGPGGAEDLLSKYDQLGWDPRRSEIDRRFGLPMVGASISKILEGMISVMSMDCQRKFRFGSLLHTGIVDTTDNPLSALSLAMKAGCSGSVISGGLSTLTSLSGSNSNSAFPSETYRPTAILKMSDLTDSFKLGAAFEAYSSQMRLELARTLRQVSSAQLRRILGSTDPHLIFDRFDRKLAELETNINYPSGELDPRLVPITKDLYNLGDITPDNDPYAIRAAIVLAALKGLAGPVAINIGGCDYHDGSQTTGDAKDFEIGREIGRAAELAHRLRSPLFIQVITDGGVYPVAGSRIWIGDSSETCMSVIGCYHPDGPVSYLDGNMQVGHYTQGQGAARDTIVGSSPLLAAYAAFANYLNVQGRMGDMERLVGRIFGNDQVKSILIFDQLS